MSPRSIGLEPIEQDPEKKKWPIEEKPKKKKKKKRRLAFRRRSKHRKPGDAHTIPSFCESNAISEFKYFSLKRGQGAARD